jgi:hypothetical protein
MGLREVETLTDSLAKASRRKLALPRRLPDTDARCALPRLARRAARGAAPGRPRGVAA